MKFRTTDAEDADCSVQFTQRSLFDEGPTAKTCPAVNASTQENLNFDVTKPIICEKCAACFSKRCTRWCCCPKCKSWFCAKCQKKFVIFVLFFLLLCVLFLQSVHS